MSSGGFFGARRTKIQKILNEAKAYTERTAVFPEEVEIFHSDGILEMMKKASIIKETPDGKIYLTEKGRSVIESRK